MVRKAVEANRAGTTAIGATYAFSRRPLSRASRPFIRPIRKVGKGSDLTRSQHCLAMTAICAERSLRIAAVEVAIGGIRAIRARVLPQDFRCNAEREMFMQRQNVMTSAPYREPFPEVSFAQESDEYRAFPRRVPVRLFGSDVAAPSR
jgi:hypothetical protein